MRESGNKIGNDNMCTTIFVLFSVGRASLIGLFSSLELNTAWGPSIITAALFLFILSLIKFKKRSELKQ